MLSFVPARNVAAERVAFFLLLALVVRAAPESAAATLPQGAAPLVRPASDEAERVRAALQLPVGVHAQIWAAQPLLADPVALSIDRLGRLYVTEHHRNRHGTEDDREHRYWVQDEFAARTVEDRLAFMQKWADAGKKPMRFYTEIPDRLVCLEDRAGKGRADTSRVLATFSEPLDGANVGVLARDGDVWVTCIPHLWRFRDDGKSEPAPGERLLSGFGVKFSFHGHDMHGVVQGPDGRIYWSIGDRGFHVRTKEGTILADVWRGAVFRSEPDGSKMEIYASGVRNPQELVFDDLGNLIAADNDNDAADEQPRLLHIIEGGDYGWHGGNLWSDDNLAAMAPGFRRPWYEDGLWKDRFATQPAWVMPPVDHLPKGGPCGLTRDPGVTLLPEKWAGSFFLTNFRGNRSSPVIAFGLEPRGNGFAMTRQEEFLNGIIPTDVEFGPDGRLYVADMVAWELAPGGGRRSGRGSIFALSAEVSAPVAAEVAKMRGWFTDGFANQPESVLIERLAHADYRVRLDAQLVLAARDTSLSALLRVATRRGDLRARVHALQALGQIQRRGGGGLERALALFSDAEPEMRAQLARQLADTPVPGTGAALATLLRDPAPRPRFFAAMALSRLDGEARQPALTALAAMLRANRDDDVYLRHAGVMAFTRFASAAGSAVTHEAVLALARDASPAVRRVVLLALRRLRAPDVASFLNDTEPSLVTEAVRAINDLSIEAALPELAALSASLPVVDDATGRRVLNARFRLGRTEDAHALADVAAHSAVPAILRREALALLAEWPKPGSRDRVTGEWSPLPDRPEAPAIAAARRVLPTLIRSSPAEVTAAAVGLASRYQIAESIVSVLAVARDPQRLGADRAAAARALVFVTDGSVLDLANELLPSESSLLRVAARDLLAARDLDGALKEFATVFEHGTLVEQQAAAATLGRLTDKRAYDFLVALSEKLVAGKLPAALALDIDEALAQGTTLNGMAGTERSRRLRLRAMREEAWLANFPNSDPLRLYRLALEGGDSAQGRQLFHNKVEFLCIRCHKIENTGISDVGPDLTGIGTRYPRDYILRAIVDPGAEIAAGFEFAELTLQDGRILSGLVQSETGAELRISTTGEKNVAGMAVKKSAIKARRAVSAMPPVISLMTPRELRDLVEYVATQKTNPTP